MSRTTRTVKKPRKQNRPARRVAHAAAGVAAIVAAESLKDAAIAAYRELGTVSAACEAAGVGRTTWYDWIEADPAFGRKVLAAHESVTDDLEKEAIKRAKDGDTTLIIFLLKSRRRAQYGDRQTVEVVSPDVQARLARQVEVIGGRETWGSGELLDILDKVWS